MPSVTLAPNKPARNARDAARQLAKLGRPQNALYPALLALGYVWVGHGRLGRSVVCMAAVFLLYALAAGYNNLHDRHTDQLNRRSDNPLAGEHTPRAGLAVFFGCNAAGLLAAQIGLRQPASSVISAAGLLLVTGYSQPGVRLQARGWLAPLTLGLCYGALPVALGLAQAPKAAAASITCLAALQGLLVIPIVLAKDYKDRAGDAATGKRTPLVLYGAAAVRWAAGVITAGGVLFYGILAVRYRLSLELAVPALIGYAAICLYLHWRRGRMATLPRKAAGLWLTAMSLALAAAIL